MLLERLRAKLSDSEGLLKEKSDSLATKEKEYATLAWEYSKVSNVQGEMSQESAQKVAAAEQKSSDLQAALNENAAVLNHAQKRVIILESNLEKEEKAREAAEEKCRGMKFEITDLCEKLAELNAQGIDVGDLERPLSRG